MNLLSLFPLPKYLRMPAVGIDISDRSIKYIEFKKHKNEFRLHKFGERKIEEGVIIGGVIKKEVNLINHLKELRTEIDNDYVISALPEEKAFLKVVQIPEMEESQVKKSMELQLEEIIPLPVKDVVFDCEIIGRLQKGGVEVSLSAFPLALANDYVNVLHKAGFTPVVFEVENQSIARALLSPWQKSTAMIVDFGRTRTSFLIAEEGAVKFTSTIPVAGESLNKSLANNLKMDIFEAERLKQKQVVNKKMDEKIITAVLPVISSIKNEIQRIFTYWRAREENQGVGKKEIDKIILCGGDSNLAGLTDYLSYELNKIVELGNPWLNVTSFREYMPEIERRESLAYVTAIGLALRSF
ncbi:MAG: type IV pilus assembly protein PilM [bacterium]|nr:type IV pilus assembly protein PilM [bacterium]